MVAMTPLPCLESHAKAANQTLPLTPRQTQNLGTPDNATPQPHPADADDCCPPATEGKKVVLFSVWTYIPTCGTIYVNATPLLGPLVVSYRWSLSKERWVCVHLICFEGTLVAHDLETSKRFSKDTRGKWNRPCDLHCLKPPPLDYCSVQYLRSNVTQMPRK